MVWTSNRFEAVRYSRRSRPVVGEARRVKRRDRLPNGIVHLSVSPLGSGELRARFSRAAAEIASHAEPEPAVGGVQGRRAKSESALVGIDRLRGKLKAKVGVTEELLRASQVGSGQSIPSGEEVGQGLIRPTEEQMSLPTIQAAKGGRVVLVERLELSEGLVGQFERARGRAAVQLASGKAEPGSDREARCFEPLDRSLEELFRLPITVGPQDRVAGVEKGAPGKIGLAEPEQPASQPSTE